MSAFGAAGFGQSGVLNWERVNSRPDARPLWMQCGDGGLHVTKFLNGMTCGQA
jgi:hypothetical protein